MPKVSNDIWSVGASTYDYRKSQLFRLSVGRFSGLDVKTVHLSFPIVQITITQTLKTI